MPKILKGDQNTYIENISLYRTLYLFRTNLHYILIPRLEEDIDLSQVKIHDFLKETLQM
jgi:hypothetical protein